MSEFVECSVCAAKMGSPVLCASCRSNRDVISHLDQLLQLANREVEFERRLRSILEIGLANFVKGLGEGT